MPKTNKGKALLLSIYVVRGSKMSRLIKEEEANGILNRLEITILFLSDFPIVGSNVF